MLLGNRGCEASLAKELVNFLVPCFGHSRDYFHSVDSVCKPDWDSGTEIVNNGCGVGGGVEFCFDNLEFEFPHVLWEIVVVVDTGVGEPSGGFGSRVGT